MPYSCGMNIKETIKRAGGQALVGKICGCTPQAVQAWINKNSLPNTEWTGKTNYALKICKQASLLGHKIDPLDLCPGAGQYMQSSEKVVQPEPEGEVSYASHRA